LDWVDIHSNYLLGDFLIAADQLLYNWQVGKTTSTCS
jgi:hypothetical protein